MERTQRVQKWGKIWFVLRNSSEWLTLNSTHKQVEGAESGGTLFSLSITPKNTFSNSDMDNQHFLKLGQCLQR